MICIECKNPKIKELYRKYESDYTTLTICPSCGKVADSYIEYDNVILFLDILLLKPKAYRHLAFNVTSSEISQLLEASSGNHATRYRGSQFFSLFKYRKLTRLVLLILLFEVYITWAYQEKNKEPSILVQLILKQKVHRQYLYFILKQGVEALIQNFLVLYSFCTIYSWGIYDDAYLPAYGQSPYKACVLLITILVSSSIKLFPILMLIWPYDKSSSSSFIINILAFLSTVEALNLTTNVSYGAILAILTVSTILKHAASDIMLSVILSFRDGLRPADLLKLQFLHRTKFIEELVRNSLYNIS